MAHHEQHDGPVGDSVLAIVAAFTSGFDVFKRLRERRRRRRSSKKSHRATPAPLEPSGDELRLSNSLRLGPVDIQRNYETNYAAAGERFAQGDAIAHASLTEVLLKLNSGLVAIIGAFLAHGKDDHHPDYRSLANLSDSSRSEAIDALGQLYQRLSQSQLVLDRIRPKCQRCGSHQHQDCASNPPRQRGGSGNAKRLPGSKPKHRRSQTELVLVRRPRNTSKHSSSRNSSSTALSAKSQRAANASSGSSASTPVTSPLPSPDPTKPQLPRSQSNSSKSEQAPPSYTKANQAPSRDKSVARKPVKTAAATTANPPSAAAPLQRPETWPNGPRPLREPTLPFIQPQPYQPCHQQLPPQHQQQQPPPYQPPRPPKLPVMTAAAAAPVELPGSAPPGPNVLQRRNAPAPPPKPTTLAPQPPPRPINRSSLRHHQQHPAEGPSNSSSADLLSSVHPSARRAAAAGMVTPSTYSFASDSTKLGEIPPRKWTVPFDYAAMERANAEAAARGNLPAGCGALGPAAAAGGGEKRKGGLLMRFLRRGSD
ncbi:hypothetical protein SLS56_008037 [Neofusicoccum ribis]|uniref:Uncharacterized protein n=1 Tax=Neofusicoccum ribis TaxID=45134 RepID=A0ABR3SL98_9PEZI